MGGTVPALTDTVSGLLGSDSLSGALSSALAPPGP